MEQHNIKLESLTELESQIEFRISEFNLKRANNQKYNKYLSLFQIITAALTTFFIAIGIHYNSSIWPIAAIATNSISILFGNILSKFMYEARMIHCISAICDLRALSFKIVMRKKIALDDETLKIKISDVRKYQQEYQTILDTANGTWRNNFKSKTKNENENENI